MSPYVWVYVGVVRVCAGVCMLGGQVVSLVVRNYPAALVECGQAVTCEVVHDIVAVRSVGSVVEYAQHGVVTWCACESVVSTLKHDAVSVTVGGDNVRVFLIPTSGASSCFGSLSVVRLSIVSASFVSSIRNKPFKAYFLA